MKRNPRTFSQRPVSPSFSGSGQVKPIFVPADQLHRQRNPRDPRIRVVFTSRIVPASQLARMHSRIYSKS